MKTIYKKRLSTIVAPLLLSGIIVTQINAQDLTGAHVYIKSTSGWNALDFDDTSVGSSFEWQLIGYANAGFKLMDYFNGNYSRVFEFAQSADTVDSLVVDTSGDINLADGSVFIDRSANRMGIGTVTPATALEINNNGSDPEITLNSGTNKFTIDNNPVGSYSYFNIGGASRYAFTMHHEAPSSSLYISSVGNIGLGTAYPQAKLDVSGDIKATWSGSNTAADGLKTLTTLSAHNSASGKVSDVGFRLENAKEGFQWDFRTLETAQGFAATKLGTNGPEFRVDNTTSDYHNVKVSMGGVVIFENGQLQTPSSRTLKTHIKPLETQAAIEAFRKLQPVSYVYKAHKDHSVVGFIAEDIPELVATKTRSGIDPTEIVAVLTKVVQEQDKTLKETQAELKKAQVKITQLEKMQKRLAKVESLLTNLALDTSNTKKESLSVK